jgi:hypothetical protein
MANRVISQPGERDRSMAKVAYLELAHRFDRPSGVLSTLRMTSRVPLAAR